MDEAAGACLCRRQGVQVGEIVAAAFAESAGGRAGQGVQALRLERRSADPTKSLSHAHLIHLVSPQAENKEV
jgi:hypothetical protein